MEYYIPVESPVKRANDVEDYAYRIEYAPLESGQKRCAVFYIRIPQGDSAAPNGIGGEMAQGIEITTQIAVGKYVVINDHIMKPDKEQEGKEQKK